MEQPLIMISQHSGYTSSMSTAFGGDLFKMTSPRESSCLDLEDQCIICADGALMCCTWTQQSYVPQQMITLEELMLSLKGYLSVPEDNGVLDTNWSPKLDRRRSSSETEALGRKGSPEQPRKNRSFTLTPGSSPLRSRRSPRSPTEAVSPKSVLLRMARQNTSDSELSESIEKDEELSPLQHSRTKYFVLDRFRSQLKWFEETGSDYVAMETLFSLTEILAFLTVIMEGRSPTALDFRVNDDKSITISYQLVKDFRQSFMMLKLKSDYCLFLAPF